MLDWLMGCCTLLQGITANKKYSLLYWAVCKSRPLRFKTLWWISRSGADEGSAPGTRTKSCCVSFVNAPPPTSDLQANTSGRKCFFGQRKKIEGSIHSAEYRTIKKKQNLQNILKKGLHWTNIAFQSFANPPRLTVIGNIRILFSDHFPGPLACTPTDLVSKKKAAVQFSLFSALAAFFWSPPNPGVKGHLWTSGRLKEQRKLEYTRLSKNPVFSGWF